MLHPEASRAFSRRRSTLLYLSAVNGEHYKKEGICSLGDLHDWRPSVILISYRDTKHNLWSTRSWASQSQLWGILFIRKSHVAKTATYGAPRRLHVMSRPAQLLQQTDRPTSLITGMMTMMMMMKRYSRVSMDAVSTRWRCRDVTMQTSLAWRHWDDSARNHLDAAVALQGPASLGSGLAGGLSGLSN